MSPSHAFALSEIFFAEWIERVDVSFEVRGKYNELGFLQEHRQELLSNLSAYSSQGDELGFPRKENAPDIDGIGLNAEMIDPISKLCIDIISKEAEL